MEGVITERDGKLYVVYESSPDWRTPMRKRLWWAIDRTMGDPYSSRRPEAGDKATSTTGDAWRTYREGCGFTGYVLFPGNKLAEHVENVPIDPPRTTVEIRWHEGRWQKLLKRGWTDA